MRNVEVVDQVDSELLISLQLPALPASAMRVAALVQDYNASTATIAEAIGSDPALAGLILRRANSPLYSLGRTVTTLPKAVLAMGNEAIHSIVIASAFSNVFARDMRNSQIGQTIWKHSLAVGQLARELSVELGLRGAEEAFTCGLLHDIGKFLLLRYDAELYSQITNEVTENGMLRFEKISFGHTHDQLGALAARRWGIPEELSHAIANHHHPSEAEKNIMMTRVVDVANQISHAAGWGVREQEWETLSHGESVIALGLSDVQIIQIWEKTEPKLLELAGNFN